MRYNRINKRSKRSQRQMSLSDGVFFKKIKYKIGGEVFYRMVFVSNREKKYLTLREGITWQTRNRIQKILEGE